MQAWTPSKRVGNGLLHGFLTSVSAERGIETRFETPATRLIVESGGVVGVEVDSGSGLRRIGARGGVVLATGGFQADTSMVRDYLRVEDHVLWGSPARPATVIGWHKRWAPIYGTWET